MKTKRRKKRNKISYQLHSPEASDPQGVDDVEVRQLQVGVEGILRFVSAFFDMEERELLRSLYGVGDGEWQ